MRNTIKLHQNFRDIFSLATIGAFILLCLYKIVSLLISNSTFSLEIIALILIVAALGVVIYYLANATLRVKFGKKNISIKINPLGFTKVNLKKSVIADIDFFVTNPITKSSGLFVHFGNRDRVYNFGGNKGMVITLKNGRTFTFFSKELYDEREEIQALFSEK
ncbi:hypothetical protein [Portibacter lacus]|uniref:PH domain-containing protein n=1 Tax=Portibacter lacus TaxID=1099794 RepID=A0AA37SPF6_9BACT|nr:hypothetical protein [Portibacter lacus]GLR18473.1 hypothetical protein GCM10007940_30890 [Portibacter lacus]